MDHSDEEGDSDNDEKFSYSNTSYTSRRGRSGYAPPRRNFGRGRNVGRGRGRNRGSGRGQIETDWANDDQY